MQQASERSNDAENDEGGAVAEAGGGIKRMTVNEGEKKDGGKLEDDARLPYNHFSTCSFG